MKTIIWKELRENVKWAVLAVLVLTLVEIYALYQQRYNFGAYNGEFTLCDSTFLLISALGCSIVGGVLGALQILPELRRDQWAALLHRPVSRGTIFFGKVIAGLLLYLLATTVPFLLSVAYVATPRQFAVPFIPRMATPAASDILLGIAIYFAALLVSLSQGPWYGRRGILAIAVLPVIFFHILIGWFSSPLIAALIFMAAGYSAMLENGNSGGGPRLARVCSVLVMLVGVETIALLVFAGLSFLPGAKDEVSANAVNRYFRVGMDGSVFLSIYGRGGERLTYLDGRPVTDERYVGNNNGSAFLTIATMFWDWRRGTSARDTYLKRHPRAGNNYIDVVDGGNEGPESWYLDVGKNYFIGYDKMSRRRIGICDRDGFRLADATPHPFPERISSSIYSRYDRPWLGWVGNQLYAFDFAERTMFPLLNSGRDKIYGAAQLTPPPAYKPFYVAVGLEKEIQILDLGGRVLLTIPYSHELNKFPRLEIGTNSSGDRVFVQYNHMGETRKAGEPEQPSFLEEVDFHGNVLHSYSAVVDNGLPMEPGWLSPATLAAYPTVPLALHEIDTHFRPSQSDNRDIDLDFQPMKFWPDNLFVRLTLLFGWSGALGIGAYLWASKVGLGKGRSLAWAIFVFCFGLPGLITFRLAARWPTRVPCPSCSRRRPIEIEECPSCHHAWPPPKTSGTEIFADSVC